MALNSGRLIFAFVLIINAIFWSQSRYAQQPRTSLLFGETGSLVKRAYNEMTDPSSTPVYASEHEASSKYCSHLGVYLIDLFQCRPISLPVENQCDYVRDECEAPDTVTNFNYLSTYFCTKPSARPLAFTAIVVWLVFLFSTLGISAADFFTPNLATICQLLGIDDNVAGVTFLAFGNGSPDLFSTFSAMHANSGSLAVGELLGAASFIVSCVVGTMCIIKPFQVQKNPFLRDVGFFTTAITLVLLTLWDGKISRWEAYAMVGMYLSYVLIVIVATWREKRKARLLEEHNIIRSEYAEETYRDEVIPTLSLTPPTPNRVRAVSAPTPPRLQTNLAPRPVSRSPSPSSSRVNQLPSFSLVGAIEFRDIVSSLQPHAAAPLDAWTQPITPFAGGHYHPPLSARSSRTVPNSLHNSVADINNEHSMTRLSAHPEASDEQHPLSFSAPIDYFTSNHHIPRDPESQSLVPTINQVPASPSDTLSLTDTELANSIVIDRRPKWQRALSAAFQILFPTLQGLHKASIISMITRITAVPPIFALTLTLPVVVTPHQSQQMSTDKMPEEQALSALSTGEDDVLVAEDLVEAGLHGGLTFNKYLMAAQCVFGPLFCVKVILDGYDGEHWVLLGTFFAGIGTAIAVLFFAGNGSSVMSRMIRCSIGFMVSMVWIMAICDEVVNILQTFGIIFGLSDAIIGLTIFAIGNSLADTVANITVAIHAPAMGFAACFGGPMLNILLGIGLSGSYIISKTQQPYLLKLSKTLFVSGFGLLFLLCGTLLFVPFNNYYLSRRWGFVLIGTYVLVMVINIVVELKG
ncbi:hypothetical protein CVT24_007114 [Panaeolus cyanescens]|uniref:Sodium/calcium exchanger membrane region domain-containing protein n=1 Tax=Panaeolus cyanescens TaxID=181874 RepID=A0A409VJU1_9AGAR|nr:hypothetical protein CVT24_007114 [Panaeolus cyanescens]